MTESKSAAYNLDLAKDRLAKCQEMVANHNAAINAARVALATAEARIKAPLHNDNPDELLNAAEDAFRALERAEKRHVISVKMAKGAVEAHRRANAETFRDEYRDAISKKISAAAKYDTAMRLIDEANDESHAASLRISACWAAGIVKPTSGCELHPIQTTAQIWRLRTESEEIVNWQSAV